MGLKTVFIIYVTTARMIFPGMPSASGPSDALKAADMPALKTVTMELYGREKASKNSAANVTVPAGLRAGNSVKLRIDLSQPTTDAEPVADVVSKSYWGCAETVPEGQPKVVGPKDTAAAEAATNLPTASYASWPTTDTTDYGVDQGVKPQGTYTLTTNFLGRTSVTLGSEQDIMRTIELTGVRQKNDLTKPHKVAWNPVPRALAYVVTAYGGNLKQSIAWTSSSDPDVSRDVDIHAYTGEELAKYIERKVFLPSTATTCTIPAGIFAACDSVFVTVTAIGADKSQLKDGVETRVVVRSKVSVPLAGTNYDPLRGMEDPPEDAKK